MLLMTDGLKNGPTVATLGIYTLLAEVSIVLDLKSYRKSGKPNFCKCCLKIHFFRYSQLRVQLDMGAQIISYDLEKSILDEVNYLSNISRVGPNRKLSFEDIDGAVEKTALAAY
jgi:hypothetical protein